MGGQFMSTLTLTQKPLVVYMREALCECGRAVGFTGVCFHTVPERYEHVCPACGQKIVLEKKYPVTFAQPAFDEDTN